MLKTERIERRKDVGKFINYNAELKLSVKRPVGLVFSECYQNFVSYGMINENFKKLFPKLFGGGRATLDLVGDDLLDAGVSVMAMPPGKVFR